MAALPYVVWKDCYSVGQEKLDSQHKIIFKLLNNLYDALQEGCGKNSIDAMIEEACQYAEQHFAEEEALLAKCGYPLLSEHKKLHEEYRKRVKELRWFSEQSTEDMAYELFNYLKEWWLNHVTCLDEKYAPYLKEIPKR